MRLLHSLPPYNFVGLEPELTSFEKARVVVLPVPYDSTVCYRTGARNGPHAIINASRNMELYDEELGFEPASVGIHTLDELEPSRDSPRETIKRVESAVAEILEKKKFPLMLGGEHSISVGAVRAVSKLYKDLTVLQLDAHSDLRDEFEGTKFGHTSVMRRISEFCDTVQVGIRSMCAEEAEFAKKKKLKLFHARDSLKPKFIVSSLKRNVYVTIDLDVFDPSEVPAVGTPEPGGLHWYDVLAILKEVASSRNVVGFDVVELCPIDGDITSDFLAARLAYKFLGYIFKNRIPKQ
ncbi:MAG: Agmatinase [Candidatus Fermentimicrarchaeum limneticum]|uniref:Agmatinase n=1 Tax=Fermentimicrarchaeum limneticum TaxID=2795018 RepID=A0A7D5XK43_FERL1|nr:MAG: Agmatinase [Candidatus Fermentimicrarchaeum limneticum]